MTVMNLDKLEVWVKVKDFALAVYKEVTPHLPAFEKSPSLTSSTFQTKIPPINHDPLTMPLFTISHSL